jgi:hypothetical protein
MARGSSAGYRARRLAQERERRQRHEGAVGSPPARARSAGPPGDMTAARAVTVPCAWCGARITPGGTWPDPEVVLGDVPAPRVGADAGRGKRPLRC